MTEQQGALILLIKSVLTHEAHTLSDDINPEEVFQIAKCHGVDVMAYYGALICGVSKDSVPMREEAMRVYKGISVSETQLAAIYRIMDEFEARGVRHMPVKGVLLKNLYPRAEMRRMGDADILIDCAQYETIRSIMNELGYTEKYESDHEFVWEKNLIHIEFHKHLIPSYNKDYYHYYGDGWRLARLMDGCSFRYKMDSSDEMIYLFTHFAKHYRDSGIGIRHIVDLWVYRRHNPDMDEEYIRRELEKLQLLEFYDNIMRTLQVWFEDRPGDEKTELITQFVFASGEYGRAYYSNLSGVLKSSKNGQSVQVAKWKRMFKAIFPGYHEMSRKYKVLKKAPFVLPIMWVVRISKKIFQKKKFQNFIAHRFNVDADNVLEYQQALNYVGLDFNFSE